MSSRGVPGILRLELGAVLILAFALSAFLCAGMHDPDYFWHLRTGQLIWENGGLPHEDPFSYTRVGAPWIVQEWLFEWVLQALHALFGDPGVRGLVGVAMAVTYALTYRTTRNYLAPGPALVICAPAFAVMLAHASPRPQLFTYLFYALFLNRLLAYVREGDPRTLRWLPALMIVWVNSHGAYIVGVAMLAAVPLALAVDRYWSRSALPTPPLRPLLICVGLTVAATLLNPYGVRHWIFPFTLAGMDAMKVIVEWAKPSIDASFCIVLALAFAYCWSLGLRKNRPSLVELGLASGSFVLAASAVRHLPFGALTLAPMLASSLGDGGFARIRQWWDGSATGVRYQRAVQGSRELGSRVYLLNWGFAAFLGVAATACLPAVAETRARADNAIVRWKAVEFVVANNITGRVFNDYGAGGLLILRRYPAEKVFIDGRADVYGDDFVRQYVKIYQGEEGWEQAFDQYAIDYVICSRQAPLHQLLLAGGQFASVYRDDDNAVLVRRVPRFEPLIQRAALEQANAPGRP